jgi:hypothetical protein
MISIPIVPGTHRWGLAQHEHFSRKPILPKKVKYEWERTRGRSLAFFRCFSFWMDTPFQPA